MDDQTKEALRDLAEAVTDLSTAVIAATRPVQPRCGVNAAKAAGRARRVLDQVGSLSEWK